jgi:hypothetical protein
MDRFCPPRRGTGGRGSPAGLAIALLLGASLCALPMHARAQGAITGITFDWSGYRQLAPGSDNWPLTWCEDDHQYTSWGDGGGFGGTNTNGRVSLGFARVTGDHAAMQTTNLWGGFDPVVDAEFNGKVVSMLCIDGVLYAWHSPSSEIGAFEWKQLIASEDKGITWQQDAFPESRVEGCTGCPGLPYSINYGRNYAANEDGYVYTFWVEIQDPSTWDVQVPGTLWLTRAPVAGAAFTDAANWEWVTGFTSGGAPVWGAEPDRAPVLQDPEGLMRGSAIYVPGIDRFLMVTNHTSPSSGNMAIWEAPQPWGPWSVVLREDDWPEDDPSSPVPAQFSFGSFGPRWFSPDGRNGVFVFFRPDAWNSVPFTLGPSAAPVPTASGAAIGVGALLLGIAWRRRVRMR